MIEYMNNISIANIKYQETLELLNKYNFDIDIHLYTDLVCAICNKILINASQSPCGCKYCYQCIEKYLSGEEKYCPGGFDNCKEQMINFERDVVIDNAINRKISMVNVKCPESFCQFTDELRNMTMHVKFHQSKCPYSDMGCNQPKFDNQKLEDHLINENSYHTNLLVNVIQNMKNEIDFLQENANRKESMIKNLKVENLDLKQEIDKIRNEEIEHVKTEIFSSKEKSQQTESLINKLLENFVESENKRHSLESRIVKMEKKQKALDEKLKAKSESVCENISMQPLFNSLWGNDNTDQIIAPFEWKIDNFQEKQLKVIAHNSGPFYSHKCGYKMHLRSYPNGFGVDVYEYLSVCFGIIAGEYDNMLPWPMKRAVTIALINQKTGAIHVSETFKFETIEYDSKSIFWKPVNGDTDDYMYGTMKFISFNVLNNNRKLLKNGAIVIKCFVT